MDLVRLGLGIRALRRRRGWRQKDLASAAGVSQELVSLIERGHADRISLHVLAAAAGALDARLAVQLRWRAGDLDRLLDADHALVSGEIVQLLQEDGWEARVEVTYATTRNTGSIDVLAWHLATRTLLVIEVKTEITSAEATLRKLDEKVRLAAEIARARFGWAAANVARLLAVEDTSTNRRRVRSAEALFEAAVPLDGRGVRHWLAHPSGAVSARLFLSVSNGGGAIQRGGGRHRLRRATALPKRTAMSVGRDDFEHDDVSGETSPDHPDWIPPPGLLSDRKVGAEGGLGRARGARESGRRAAGG
ncbi:MAG: helix-turn-helix domain-containing protein [Chloroflexi bacterium]|nr:helix-turn-helix domain-containing protein [Chloroflexota bacterium]